MDQTAEATRPGPASGFVSAADTIEECEQYCLDRPSCEEITFRVSDKRCAYYNEAADDADLTANVDYILSTKNKIIIPRK